MWTSNVVSKVLEGVEDDSKRKSMVAYTSPFAVHQNLQEEIDISLVGPPLWATEWDMYYAQAHVELASEGVVSVAPKRRVNNFTSSGRPAAAILYQELSKVNVDAHRLVDPYNYGEQLGPAENFSQPFKIDVHPQVGFLSDIHGHLCDAEVIGLLAGKWDAANKRLYIQAPFPCAATERHEDFGFTDVELDPEAEWKVRQSIAAQGLEVVGWYHSHPKFKPSPSVMDIFNQQQYQLYTRDERTGEEPFVGLIVSTYDSQLSSPASDHQWFTVVPYAPPARKNSIIDDDDSGDELPRGGGREEVTDAIYLPVRMSVTYRSVNLSAAFASVEAPSSVQLSSSSACGGFVDDSAAYAVPLLKSLMALRVREDPSATQTSSSAATQPGDVKVEGNTTAAAPTKRKYTPRKPKVHVGDGAEDVRVESELTRKTLSAEALAAHNLPALSTVATAAKKSALLSKAKKNIAKSVSTNSLQPTSVSTNSLQAATSTAESDEVELPVRVVQISKYDQSGDDNSYWRALPGPPSTDSGTLAEITPSTSSGAIAAITAMNIGISESAADPAVLHGSPTPEQSDVISDAELARRIGAEEEAQAQLGGRARRASRDTKKNDRFGDFVDTLEVTKHLRKQNMDHVKAAELKQKQKVAADRAKLKAQVMSVVPILKDEPDSNKKQKVTLEQLQSNGTSKNCDECVPPFSLIDSTLCGTVVPQKRISAAPVPKKTDAKEAFSVFNSIILALQDIDRPCAALAREMLCSVVPSYRGLVLVVVSLGFYYARSPRRVDLSKNWKGHARIEKIKTSAGVWLQRLGMSPESCASSPDASTQATAASTQHSTPRGENTGLDAVSGAAPDSDNQEGGTSKESTEVTVRSSSSSKLSAENTTHRLTEWVGAFLTACWEDYSKIQNRKRKI